MHQNKQNWADKQSRTPSYQEGNFDKLPLVELRQQWAQAWGMKPHARIGRSMLSKSLAYKLWEQATGGLSLEQQSQLAKLIAMYKRNPRCFDNNYMGLKPGVKLIKVFKGKRHSVHVMENGFDYDGKIYNSLSEIASLITGTRWNGWLFFGLKNTKVNKTKAIA